MPKKNDNTLDTYPAMGVESVREVLKAHLLAEGKILAVTLLAYHKTSMTLVEAAEKANLSLGEADLGRAALRAAGMAEKKDDDLVVLKGVK